MSAHRGVIHQRHEARALAGRVLVSGLVTAIATVAAWWMYLRFPDTGSYYSRGFRTFGFPIFAVLCPPYVGTLLSQYARFWWLGTLFYRTTPEGVVLTFRKWWLLRPALVAPAGSAVTLIVGTYRSAPMWRRWTCEVDGKSISIRAIDRADADSLREFKRACRTAGVSVTWRQE